MLLMVFWNSLGLILGALGAFLVAILMFLQAFGGPLNSHNFFLASLPGQTYCSFCVSCFAPFLEVVVFLIFEPLGVDFKLSSWPSDPQKPRFYVGGSSIFKESRFVI